MVGKTNKAYIFLILAGICFLLYANALNGEFLVDDIEAIKENPFITASPLTFWNEPTSLLNTLIYKIAKENPVFYHIVSVAVHSLVTILVFCFLRLFFSLKASFLSACIFAVNPVNSEAVAWISGKPYLLNALFILLVYLLYYKSTTDFNHDKKLNFVAYLFALLIFSYYSLNNIGFFSMTVFLLILSDLTFGRLMRNWKFLFPFIMLLSVRLMFAWQQISQRLSFMASISGDKSITITNPFVVLAFTLVSHVSLLLFPWKLSFYHEPVNIMAYPLSFSVIFTLLLVILLILLHRHNKPVFFAVSIFVLFLAPVYSPWRLSSCYVAERYIYFPSIALCILAAWFFDKSYGANKKLNNLTLIFFVILLLLYSARTVLRNDDFKAVERFWWAALLASPKSPSAHNGIGLVYYKDKNYPKANEYFSKAIKLNPIFVAAHNNLGNLYYDAGNRDMAELEYKRVIEINPLYIEAYNNLANLYSEAGKSLEAIGLYNKVIEINPADKDAYYNLGIAYMSMGNKQEAEFYFKKEISLFPRDTAALLNLGTLYATSGKDEEAESLFQRVIRIDHNSREAYSNLALVYLSRGDLKLANLYCEKAGKLGDNSRCLKALGNIGIK